jgi:hypothetical protein
MKNLVENFALFLVAILSLAILFFIVQYNIIEEDDILESLVFEKNTTMDNKEKTKNYLDALEGYGDDKDIEVDAKVENDKNTVSIESELKEDALDITIEDTSKSSYMENLNNYSEKDVEKKVIKKEEKPKKVSSNPSGEPEKLEKDEIVDEVGMAIDALDL